MGMLYINIANWTYNFTASATATASYVQINFWYIGYTLNIFIFDRIYLCVFYFSSLLV